MPNSNGTAVASYYSNAYVGQYSSGSCQRLCLPLSSADSCPRGQIHRSTILVLGVSQCITVSCTVAHIATDFRLHIYDTTAPIIPTDPTRSRLRGMRGLIPDDHETSMKVIKTIEARPGGWTITDSHLSPDNQRYVSQGLHRMM